MFLLCVQSYEYVSSTMKNGVLWSFWFDCWIWFLSLLKTEYMYKKGHFHFLCFVWIGAPSHSHTHVYTHTQTDTHTPTYTHKHTQINKPTACLEPWFLRRLSLLSTSVLTQLPRPYQHNGCSPNTSVPRVIVFHAWCGTCALQGGTGRGGDGGKDDNTHLIICGTVTLLFSSKAFIIRPLQRMLSMHCCRGGEMLIVSTTWWPMPTNSGALIQTWVSQPLNMHNICRAKGAIFQMFKCLACLPKLISRCLHPRNASAILYIGA